MAQDYVVDDLAGFVVAAEPVDLAGRSRAMLKRNVLDSIACAVGALDGELIPAIREHTEQFSGRPTTTLVGGGSASVDQAAFFNAVLVRTTPICSTPI
jgi:2-methylcitrate dehydratase